MLDGEGWLGEKRSGEGGGRGKESRRGTAFSKVEYIR